MRAAQTTPPAHLVGGDGAGDEAQPHRLRLRDRLRRQQRGIYAAIACSVSTLRSAENTRQHAPDAPIDPSTTSCVLSQSPLQTNRWRGGQRGTKCKPKAYTLNLNTPRASAAAGLLIVQATLRKFSTFPSAATLSTGRLTSVVAATPSQSKEQRCGSSLLVAS